MSLIPSGTAAIFGWVSKRAQLALLSLVGRMAFPYPTAHSLPAGASGIWPNGIGSHAFSSEHVTLSGDTALAAVWKDAMSGFGLCDSEEACASLHPHSVGGIMWWESPSYWVELEMT